MAPLTDEKYLSLTTFRKDGSPVSTPVWIADLGDGTAGFTTASSSYKIKRIRNNPKVTVQPCDAKGNVRDGSDVVSGTAEIRTGADFERVKSLIKGKYGFQYTMISFVGQMAKLIGKGSGTDTALVLKLND